jgi:hypothetical protein
MASALRIVWSMADQARNGPPAAEHDDILTTGEAARLLKAEAAGREGEP